MTDSSGALPQLPGAFSRNFDMNSYQPPFAGGAGKSGWTDNYLDRLDTSSWLDEAGIGGGGGVPKTANGGGGGFFSLDTWLGNDKQMGLAAPLLGTAQLGFETWLGMQNLGVAKDTLNFQKDSFSKQFENQRTLTNADLRDRQNRRYAANPNAQSVGSYMQQNGV